ncbi:diaminopimelate decarboxylase [Candidatus Vidania fulgoroideorum]
MKNIKKIIKKVKTPFFIYKKKKIIKNINKYKKKNVKIFYALKANYNKKIIKIIKKRVYGFEVVSIGEIKKLLNLNVKGKKIIFSGVCKKKKEIKFAEKKKIGFISVESYDEFKRVMKKKIKIILKINLNVGIDSIKQITTCKKNNKFGINEIDLLKIIKNVIKHKINIYCLGFHLGSQILDHKPYIKALKKIIKIYKYFRKKKIKINKIINIGGGFGIDYVNGSNINFFKKIYNFFKKFKIIIEPGRSIIGNTCKTISKVEYIKKNKKKRIAILDVGMDCLIRPALYKSIHRIKKINKNKNKKKIYDLVGPICESTDIIRKNIKINLKKGEKIIICDTGAYCMSMRMNYNMRKKPKEVII